MDGKLAPCHLYVSIAGEDKIKIFDVNAQTGRLTSIGEVAAKGRPAPMTIDPGQQFIYVGRKDDRQISTYRRNFETGALLLIGTALLENDPDYLTTDRKGRFLLSTYFSAGTVAVHKIGNDGVVQTPPVEWFITAKGAHSIQADPSNRFVFVPHIASNPYCPDAPNIILQFKFNEATGRLTANTPDRVIPDKHLGPRHFCFHPDLDILYCCNQEGNSVTAYRFDTSRGILTAFQTVSTLPDAYKGENGCAEIQIAPSGRFIYVSNRGHNSIAYFSVNARTGRLTIVGYEPTEAVPRAFILDPYGEFLFAAGEASGRLAVYRVNKDTGELTLIETYIVGKSPEWVLFTRPTR